MEWKKIDSVEHLPPHGKKVIAFYKNSHQKSRMVMAQHFEAMKEECNCEDDCDCQYSKEKDNFYYPEGWYEVVENWDEWSFINIYDEVTDWKTLPDSPDTTA